MELTPVDPYTWVRVIRRCRFGSPGTKLVALTLADYASPHGGDVRPGNERLANVTELNERSVRRALDTLRDLGLIDRVRQGSRYGRRAWADEYQLTVPADLGELSARIEMLDPDERPVDNPESVDIRPGDPVDDQRLPASNHRTSDARTPDMRCRITGRHVHPPNQAPTSYLPAHNFPHHFGAVEVRAANAPPVDNPNLIIFRRGRHARPIRPRCGPPGGGDRSRRRRCRATAGRGAMSSWFETQRRRAVEALAKRVRERDQSDDPVDAELIAVEFVTALCGQGWRPVEALQPPPEPTPSQGLPAEYLERKRALTDRTERTP